MGEGLGLFLKDWGPESLVAAFVLALISGLLETRWSVKKKMDLSESRTREALEREKYYRATNEKLQETVRLQTEQLDKLMEQARTTLALVGSIEATAYDNRRSGRHSGPG